MIIQKDVCYSIYVLVLVCFELWFDLIVCNIVCIARSFSCCFIFIVVLYLRTVYCTQCNTIAGWGMPWEFVGLDNLDIHTKSGAIEGYNSMLYFSPMIKFGGIAYYAQGGLGNDPIWGDVLDIIYSGFQIMIENVHKIA